MFVSVFYSHLLASLHDASSSTKPVLTEKLEETQRKQEDERKSAKISEIKQKVKAKVTEDESEEIESPADETRSKGKTEEKRSVKEELARKTSEKLKVIGVKSEKISEKLSRTGEETHREVKKTEIKSELSESIALFELTEEKKVKSEPVFDVKPDYRSVKAELETSVTELEFITKFVPEAEQLKIEDVPPQKRELLIQDQMKPSVSLKPEEEIKIPSETAAGGTIIHYLIFNRFIRLWLVAGCLFSV